MENEYPVTKESLYPSPFLSTNVVTSNVPYTIIKWISNYTSFSATAITHTHGYTQVCT